MNLQIFGERIRQQREKLGLSQEDLGGRINKTQHAVSQYETGVRRMYISDLEALASSLEVPVAYFFTGAVEADDIDEMILQELKRLPSIEMKQSLFRIIREMCDLILEP